jgi:phage terminase large subunit-like protein
MTRPDAALTILAAMVLEDGQLWGDVAAPFQWEDAAAIFSDDGPHWHFLTRARGGSKTTDLAGVSLAWLATIAAPGARGYVFAGDKEQAALLTDAASGLVDRTPELRASVKVDAFKITGKNGATVEVRAADGGGAFGLRPSFIVCDELAQWEETRRPRRLWTAIVSALAKVPGCRFVCLTSAGEPAHWAAKVIADAKAHPERWHVNEVPGPLPWVDVADLEAQGLRDSEFQRLHLNRWTQSEDRLVSAADLLAAAVLDGEQEPRAGVRYLVSVDLGLVNDKTVVAVGHSEPISPEPGAPERVVIDSLRRWRGKRLKPVNIGEVEAYLSLTSKRYNRAKILADPWQAAGMIQRLAAQGVRCEPYPFTSSSTGRIGQALHLALRNHLLWLPDDDELLSELARVRLRETGIGQARLDHDSGDHDDQAVAIAIIVAELLGTVKSGFAREMESEYPIHACGMPNPKTAERCQKCREPLTVPVETPHEHPSEPVPWSLTSPFNGPPPDPNTIATLRFLQEQARPQLAGRRY